MILGRHFFYHSLIEVPEKVALVDNLNAQAKRLVAVSGLFILGTSLSSIFLVIYLFKINSDITKPLFFYLGTYIGITFAFILGGYLLKFMKLGMLLAVGLLISTLLYLNLVFLGERSADYVFILGFFLGIGEGFFWLVRHVVEYLCSKDSNRDRLFASMYMVGTVGTILGPIISGFLIVSGQAQNFPGYLLVFGLSAVFFLAASLIALKFDISQKLEYSFKEIFFLEKHNHSWRGVELADLIHGIRMGAGQVLIGIVVFLILKNEFDVGGVATLGAALSLAVGYAIGKFSTYQQRFTISVVGSIVGVISYIVLMAWFNVTGLFVYVLLMGAAAPALFIIFGSLNNKAIDVDARTNINRVISYKINNEIFWNIGRVISVGVFLMVLHYLNLEEATKVFLLVSVIVFPLMVIIYKHYKLFGVR